MLVLPTAAKAVLSGTSQPRTGARPIRVQQALSARHGHAIQSSGMLVPLSMPVMRGILSVALCARHVSTLGLMPLCNNVAPKISNDLTIVIY